MSFNSMSVITTLGAGEVVVERGLSRTAQHLVGVV